MRRIALLGVPAGVLWFGTACEIDAGPDNGESPAILVTVNGNNFSSDDPAPGTDISCVEVADAPTRINVVASDSGGLERLYIHMLDGFVVDGSVDVRPDEDDVSWEITTGDNVLNMGDDELTVSLVPPTEDTVRNGVNVTFDLEGPDRFALETLATDYAGNDSITWPIQIHQVDLHGNCP